MTNYICIDTSVFIKLFVEEQDSFKAKALFQLIIQCDQIIALPSFAPAEMGSIFRKKIRNNMLTRGDAEEMWEQYRNFPGVIYIEEPSIMDRAWTISNHFDLPTLYDAAFLAVAEEIYEKTGQVCEFWTADERLVNSLQGKKDCVKLLSNF